MKMKRKLASETNNFVVCEGEAWGHEKWSELENALKGQGELVTMVYESDSVSKVADALVKAQVLFCEEGWIQHVARSMNVPCIVLWNGGDPEIEGWPEQFNIKAAEGLGSVSAEDVLTTFNGK
jgi:ADP-heptose:LPS heptosyltransferase